MSPQKKKSAQVNFYGVKMTSERLFNSFIPQKTFIGLPLQNEFLATPLVYARPPRVPQAGTYMYVVPGLSVAKLFDIMQNHINFVAEYVSKLLLLSSLLLLPALVRYLKTTCLQQKLLYFDRLAVLRAQARPPWLLRSMFLLV